MSRAQPQTAPRCNLLFRYDAVVFGSGEIGEILESIGRRQFRRVDPAGREGRLLLNAGLVQLWRGPHLAGEKAPVETVLGRLREAVEHDQSLHPGDRRWDDCCRKRLAAIDRWKTVYRPDH